MTEATPYPGFGRPGSQQGALEASSCNLVRCCYLQNEIRDVFQGQISQPLWSQLHYKIPKPLPENLCKGPERSGKVTRIKGVPSSRSGRLRVSYWSSGRWFWSVAGCCLPAPVHWVDTENAHSPSGWLCQSLLLRFLQVEALPRQQAFSFRGQVHSYIIGRWAQVRPKTL